MSFSDGVETLHRQQKEHHDRFLSRVDIYAAIAVAMWVAHEILFRLWR